MYAEGQGVEADLEQAFYYFRLAADQGHADAQNRVGLMYDEGRGVAVDDVEAIRWYERAAEQGLAVAFNNLGLMYEYGEGVDRDLNQAVQYYQQAIEAGYAESASATAKAITTNCPTRTCSANDAWGRQYRL